MFIVQYRLIHLQMEEDQEIIKKLMAMLGNGKEIKFKSPDGQTIKVSFEGSSYNETSVGSEKSCHLSENLTIKNSSEEEQKSQSQVEKQNIPEKTGDILSQIQDDLQQMANDFNSLSQIKENNFKEISETEEDLIILDFKHLEVISENQTIFSKNEDNHSLKELIYQEETGQGQTKPKTKKIELSKKKLKTNNQTVINFFKDQNNSLEKDDLFSNHYNSNINFPVYLPSSPLVQVEKYEMPTLPHHKSQTVKQSINKLKELHPESQKIVDIISQRINQLEQIEKSISLINSSISNSMSLHIESFQVSMLSFNKSSNDPLCNLMAQFINKAKQAKNKSSKEIPSSFLFMYSQPLLYSNDEQILNQIDYYEEEQIIKQILKEGKCKVDYIHTPATIQKFHYWITQGVEILHFCGHGIKDKENYLIFQNEEGCSEHLTVSRLHDLLNTSKISLKLVFVASCHSESAGQVFLEAGASHVICIKDEYKILDQACHQFVKLFYLSCINSKLTICEAFQFSKKQMILKGKFGKHQCQKFIIIRNHQTGNCKQHFEHRNEIQNFNDLNPRPIYNKYMLSRVQHYIPRSKEIYDIMQLISNKRRYITIVGQSGLGKSTLARELVRYIQFRNCFIDGVVYLELSQCQTIAKVFELLDIQFFEVSQLRLNKTLIQNSIRLSKQIGQKNLLIVFDNCQTIMASEDKQQFKKITEIIMKNCIKVSFIFTNRYSISKQIDYCSEVLFQLQKLSEKQAKALFFKKIPRTILKKQYDDFFKLDENKELKQISKHSFFQFLNGHPEAICLTASLLSERTLPELHKLFLAPNMNNEINKKMQKELIYTEGIHKIVSTAMKISLNVIHHKYKDSSEMIKILSLLPNGLEKEMMNKIFANGEKWKHVIKRLMDLSLIQCVERTGVRYYMVHPQIIRQIQNEIGLQQKIRYHQKICEEYVKRINKLYRTVGTSSQYSQRAQELFLIEEDNYRAIFFRELNFIGQKYPLRKFYENLFKCQFQGMDEEQKNDFGQNKLSDAQILNIVELNKKKKNLQSLQKKEAIDLIMVYYITILFLIKKVKNSSVETYLNYGFVISHKRNKYLVFANLLRIKACIYMTQCHDNDAKMFFQIAHAQFAQLGCGLGSACCEAALGYIKLYESQYAPAKKNLQNALKYYEQIPHAFGKHYLNRWLCSLKSKMNKQERELINHKMQAQKLLKETKQLLRSNNFNNLSCIKHKFGYFAFRFLFDNISLFLQATFEIDLKPKFINQQVIKKNQRSISNVVLGQYSNLSNNMTSSTNSHQYNNPSHIHLPSISYENNISNNLYNLSEKLEDYDEPDYERKHIKMDNKLEMPEMQKQQSELRPKMREFPYQAQKFIPLGKKTLQKKKVSSDISDNESIKSYSSKKTSWSSKTTGLAVPIAPTATNKIAKQILPIIKQTKQTKQKRHIARQTINKQKQK